MGVIYEIGITGATRKGYPKREIQIEIPISYGDKPKTVIRKFVVFGDECGSLDFFSEGEFVEFTFELSSFWWQKPETDEKILLQSEILVSIQTRDNPFDTKEEIDDKPEDLSPDPIAKLQKDVEKMKKETEGKLPFEKNDNIDPLPF